MTAITAGQALKLKTELSGIPKGIEKATARAMNKTIEGVRTDVVEETESKYYVKKSDLRKTIQLSKANASNLLAYLRSTGKAIPLVDFKTNPNEVVNTKKKDFVLKAAVKRDGMKPIQGAFYATIRSGVRSGIYIRKDDRRFPIISLFGPSVPQMLGEEETLKLVQKGAIARLDKNLDHEIKRILQEVGR